MILNPQFVVCDETGISAGRIHPGTDPEPSDGSSGGDGAHLSLYHHDLSVVRHISDEIMVMYLGKCVEKAEAKEIFRNPLHPYTKALLASIPIPSVESCHKQRELIKGEGDKPW